jgi:hypothetical protein
MPGRRGKWVIAIFRVTDDRRLAAVAARTGSLSLRVHAKTGGAKPSITLGGLRPAAIALVTS